MCAEGPRPATSWSQTLATLLRGDPVDEATAAWAMDEIMAGNATSAQIAAFAVLLRAKGETATEVAGLVSTMLARRVPVRLDRRAVDVVGTGGDVAHTVNITTMAALVAAATGRPVVKHGNRSASSLCGTADVLEELGVAIDLGPDEVARTVAEIGIGFCFAPVFHAGMRHAGPTRREIGVPTVFNLLGPLTNPARPSASAIGCADPRALPIMAAVLARRGDTALVFRGDDGLDELTTTTSSRVWVACGGTAAETTIDPGELGLERAAPDSLRGGDRSFNASVVNTILAGNDGPIREAVLLNAAAAIVAFDQAGAATGSAHAVADSLPGRLRAGVREAAEAIDSGAGRRLLSDWVGLGNALRAG
ncbi:MAG: anthranilate phosphoribosyltransferase [Actinobacteria bacterium]|nr:anthranilate phosphoribosyltransferase [Actinomycetota bacterium]